jgi:hypothetical protein
MGDRWRFVNKIDAAPTVLLDLNDETKWSVRSCDLTPPQVRRSLFQSMMADGARPGATAFDNRTIKLTLELIETTQDNAAVETQKLVRELDRETNILEYRPTGASNSVFFRTYRSSAEQIEDIIAAKALRDHTVSILAEPFGLGLMETPVTAATVNNDPAHATNGCKLDITGIKGDVEAPLVLEYSGGASGANLPGLVAGLRAGASPYPAVFRQAESLTLGSDTASVADATFSGGNKARCTFATVATMAARVTGSAPTGTLPAGVENRGVYRVFARMAKTVSGDSIKVRITQNGGTSFEQEVTLAATTAPQLVDLGKVAVNTTKPRTAGYGGTAVLSETLPFVVVQAQRVSGTGNLDIDYLLWVPADARLSMWGTVAASASGSPVAVVDSPNELIYGALTPFGATPSVYDGVPTGLIGGFPIVEPGDNRLILAVLNPANAAAGNVITTALTVTARYWPRYMHVRPATT